MDERSSRLESLRIDRSEPASAPARMSPLVYGWVAVAAGALVLIIVAWFVLKPAPVEEAAAPAPAATTAAVPESASILDASGYVVARRQATVASKLTGKLIEVLIEEGQHVEAGQILARLDDSNMRASHAQAAASAALAEANLSTAKVALEDFEPSFKRNEELFKRGAISAHDVELARSEYNAKRMAVNVAQQTLAVSRATLGVANQNLDDTVVRAPFAGVVTVKAAEPGEMVSPGATGGSTRTGICTIVDMDSLEVEIDVSESFISRVRPGLPVVVKLNAYPDWQIPAEVLAVIPTADRAKATVKVRVGLKAKDPRIVPEMGAHVSFLSEANQQQPASQPQAVEGNGNEQ